MFAFLAQGAASLEVLELIGGDGERYWNEARKGQGFGG